MHSRLIGIPTAQLPMVGEKELLVPGKKAPEKAGRTGYRKNSH